MKTGTNTQSYDFLIVNLILAQSGPPYPPDKSSQITILANLFCTLQLFLHTEGADGYS